jgi:hypothetical protein
MPKSKQIKKRGRKPNKIVRGLENAVSAVVAAREPQQAALNARMKAMLDDVAGRPSSDTMSLAQMIFDAARGRKVKKTVADIAEMLETTINVRRAQAEFGGVKKGITEATEALERQIIEGVMARVDTWDNFHSLPPTISVASRDMQLIVGALRKAGYRQERHGPHPHHQA